MEIVTEASAACIKMLIGSPEVSQHRSFIEDQLGRDGATQLKWECNHCGIEESIPPDKRTTPPLLAVHTIVINRHDWDKMRGAEA